MESNRRTVLISIVGIVAAIGLMVGVGFGLARRLGHPVRQVEQPSAERSLEGGSLSYDLDNFSQIVVLGGWSVSISQGSDYSVGVSASESALDAVEVSTRGDSLLLDLTSGIKSVTGNLAANIVLPDLKRLETSGGVKIDIRGFDLDSLEISAEGAANISAHNGRISDLQLKSQGAGTFDFTDVKVGSANIDMDGASNLEITMDGGDLTGALRGLGNVSYGGTVANESVRVDGLGRVHRK